MCVRERSMGDARANGAARAQGRWRPLFATPSKPASVRESSARSNKRTSTWTAVSCSSSGRSPVVRPIRFHDLRHTTATPLLREKVPLVVVQKVFRHRDPSLTESVYGHLADDFPRGTQTPPDARRAGVPRGEREDVRPF